MILDAISQMNIDQLFFLFMIVAIIGAVIVDALAASSDSQNVQNTPSEEVYQSPVIRCERCSTVVENAKYCPDCGNQLLQ